MSNKDKFKSNLYSRVRIRPLVYYANLGKYFDEEWTIDEITDGWFHIYNQVNGYGVRIGHDARREWMDDFSRNDGLSRGVLILKAQVVLRDGNSYVEPLTDSLLSEVMKRSPDAR